MSEFKPLSSKEELDSIDGEECVAGYWSGRNGDPEPGSDKSRSFWHGWKNGSMDFGFLKPDIHSQSLAESVVRSWRAH